MNAYALLAYRRAYKIQDSSLHCLHDTYLLAIAEFKSAGMVKS